MCSLGCSSRKEASQVVGPKTMNKQTKEVSATKTENPVNLPPGDHCHDRLRVLVISHHGTWNKGCFLAAVPFKESRMLSNNNKKTKRWLEWELFGPNGATGTHQAATIITADRLHSVAAVR